MTGEARFDRVGERYEELIEHSIGFCGQEHGFYLEAKARHLVDLVRRTLGDPRDVRVLDIGCGTGALHAYLDAFPRLEGVDPSSEVLEVARREHPHVTYHHASGQALPFADAAVDVALLVAVLHHVGPHERAAVVAETARVVRPGGIVVVFEHNPLNPLTRVAVARCEFDDDAVLLDVREARRIFAGGALDIVEHAYVLFFPWRGALFERAERALAHVPLGAQYYVAARRRAIAPPR